MQFSNGAKVVVGLGVLVCATLWYLKILSGSVGISDLINDPTKLIITVGLGFVLLLLLFLVFHSSSHKPQITTTTNIPETRMGQLLYGIFAGLGFGLLIILTVGFPMAIILAPDDGSGLGIVLIGIPWLLVGSPILVITFVVLLLVLKNASRSKSFLFIKSLLYSFALLLIAFAWLVYFELNGQLDSFLRLIGY